MHRGANIFETLGKLSDEIYPFRHIYSHSFLTFSFSFSLPSLPNNFPSKSSLLSFHNSFPLLSLTPLPSFPTTSLHPFHFSPSHPLLPFQSPSGGAKVSRNFSYFPAKQSHTICSLPKLVINYKKYCLTSLEIGFSCNNVENFSIPQL